MKTDSDFATTAGVDVQPGGIVIMEAYTAPFDPPVEAAEPADETVEGFALRCASLVCERLSWDDARMALFRGMKLLREWERSST